MGSARELQIWLMWICGKSVWSSIHLFLRVSHSLWWYNWRTVFFFCWGFLWCALFVRWSLVWSGSGSTSRALCLLAIFTKYRWTSSLAVFSWSVRRLSSLLYFACFWLSSKCLVPLPFDFLVLFFPLLFACGLQWPVSLVLLHALLWIIV